MWARDFVTVTPWAIYTLLTVIPSVRLLRRAGIHPALSAFNLFPILGTIALLWIVAYSKWPKAQAAQISN